MSQRMARASRQVKSQMTGRKRLLLALLAPVIVGIVVAGVWIASGHGPAPAVSVASNSSIAFGGTDPVSGKQVLTSDYAGTPLVVNVWGSWCEGCNAEATDLKVFVERHPEMQMIGIDLQDSKGGAQDFYRRWGWDHPSVYDPDGKIAFRLGLQGTPTTFFLDKSHRIVARIVGATDLAGFEKGLAQALTAA